MVAHAEEYEMGTCSWIDEAPAYIAWRDSGATALLCVTGKAGSDGSMLGAFVCETLRDKADGEGRNLMQFVSPDAASSDGRATIKMFESTLVRGIYEHSLDDVNDGLLLQRCNRLFAHPKQVKGKV